MDCPWTYFSKELFCPPLVSSLLKGSFMGMIAIVHTYGIQENKNTPTHFDSPTLMSRIAKLRKPISVYLGNENQVIVIMIKDSPVDRVLFSSCWRVTVFLFESGHIEGALSKQREKTVCAWSIVQPSRPSIFFNDQKKKKAHSTIPFASQSYLLWQRSWIISHILFTDKTGRTSRYGEVNRRGR